MRASQTTADPRTKTGKQVSPFLVGVLLAGLMGTALLAAWLLWQIGRAIDSPVGAGLIVASGAVIAALITGVVAKERDRRMQIEQEHRKQKMPTYESFMDGWFRLAFAEKTKRRPMTESEQVQFMLDFSKQLIIWGNVALIEKWGNMRKLFMNGANGVDMLWEIEEILLMMREDLGNSNKGIRRGDLLRLFINDIDVYLYDIATANKESSASTLQALSTP